MDASDGGKSFESTRWLAQPPWEVSSAAASTTESEARSAVATASPPSQEFSLPAGRLSRRRLDASSLPSGPANLGATAPILWHRQRRWDGG
jgi:hypothetical protein